MGRVHRRLLIVDKKQFALMYTRQRNVGQTNCRQKVTMFLRDFDFIHLKRLIWQNRRGK